MKQACVQLRAAQLPPEWAMVEAQGRPRGTTGVPEIRSLMDSLREELPEFRRAQALGYPLAGMISLIVMATNGAGQYLCGMITEAKSNEIPATRLVLRQLDLAGKFVLRNAMESDGERGRKRTENNCIPETRALKGP